MSGGTRMPGWELPAEREPDDNPEPQDAREPVPGTGTAEPAWFPEPVPGTSEMEPEPEPFPGMVPGTAEPGTGHDPGTGDREPGGDPWTVPEPTVPRERIGLAEDTLTWFRRWARLSAAEQKKHGGFWYWLWSSLFERNPDSARQVYEYGSSREWMQPYMTGRIRTLVEWENILYNRIIAVPLVTIFNKLSDTAARQSRFWAAFLLVVVALLIYLAHH